jgi:tRNA threonylcarbamoyladenosine biosynthesis protein TsaB
MACILCLETATKVCSVALSLNDELLFKKEEYAGPSHAALLAVFVQEAVDYAEKNRYPIEAIAVSSGPGSYTGLRIGISEAKGLCYGMNIPLIAVPTLAIMASQAIRAGIRADAYCPMIDARRMEVYAAVYNRQMQIKRPPGADIVTGQTCEEFLSEGTVLFFGDGAGKCKELISSKNAIFVENIHPLATGMIPLAHQYYQEKNYQDIAYFEPFYLKEFQTTKKQKE